MNRGIKRILLLVSGIILTIASYIIEDYSIIRIVFLLIGILCLLGQFVYERKRKIVFIILYAFILFNLFGVIDYLVVKKYNRIPIFTLNIIENNNLKIYDALGYRVWQCDKNRKEYVVDSLKKLGYFCDTDDVQETNINSLVPQIVNDFSKFQNTFIKIEGKISQKVGDDYFLLQPYDVSDNINGIVNFHDNLTLKVYTNASTTSINDYRVYDSIILIGRITKLEEKNAKYVIDVNDIKIMPQVDSNFSLEVSLNKACQKDKKLLTTIDNSKIYTSCVNNVLIKYEKGATYELLYALENKNIKWNDFLAKANNYAVREDFSVFSYNKFDVLKCQDGSYVIASRDSETEKICSLVIDEGTV